MIKDELERVVSGPPPHDYKPVALLATRIVEQWVASSHTPASEIGYCASLHVLARMNTMRRNQERIANELAVYLV